MQKADAFSAFCPLPSAFICYPHSYPVKPLLLSLALLIGTVASAEPLRIGTVTIHALDVYSSEEAGKGWLYRVADRLHVETRRTVIEKFLLFRKGDVYSPERLAETERNLLLSNPIR